MVRNYLLLFWTTLYSNAQNCCYIRMIFLGCKRKMVCKLIFPWPVSGFVLFHFRLAPRARGATPTSLLLIQQTTFSFADFLSWASLCGFSFFERDEIVATYIHLIDQLTTLLLGEYDITFLALQLFRVEVSSILTSSSFSGSLFIGAWMMSGGPGGRRRRGGVGYPDCGKLSCLSFESLIGRSTISVYLKWNAAKMSADGAQERLRRKSKANKCLREIWIL